MKAWRLRLLLVLATLASVGMCASVHIRAGTASISIAPTQPAWLAGYPGRSHPSEPGSGDIRARALAIDDGSGGRVVLISGELLALPRVMTEMVAAEIMRRNGLDRGQILINATGTHSAPFVRGLQPLLAPAGAEEQGNIADYSAELCQSLVELAAAALSKMQPALLSFSVGRATFPVNASFSGNASASSSARSADTTVPVFKVATPSGITLAVVFGYSRPAATLGADSYVVGGDYAGVAAASLERDFPGSVALFVRLCDGDQTPCPPGSEDSAALHAAVLGAEVRRVLKSPMRAVTGPLHTALIETTLTFAPRSRDEYETESRSTDPIHALWARRLLAALAARGELRSMPYPVQAIRFGKSFAVIALAGEPAASYAQGIRKLLTQENLLIAGGTNDAGYFIPGAGASDAWNADSADRIFYSGLPGAFTSETEGRILDAVKRAWSRALK